MSSLNNVNINVPMMKMCQPFFSPLSQQSPKVQSPPPYVSCVLHDAVVALMDKFGGDDLQVLVAVRPYETRDTTTAPEWGMKIRRCATGDTAVKCLFYRSRTSPRPLEALYRTTLPCPGAHATMHVLIFATYSSPTTTDVPGTATFVWRVQDNIVAVVMPRIDDDSQDETNYMSAWRILEACP